MDEEMQSVFLDKNLLSIYDESYLYTYTKVLEISAYRASGSRKEAKFDNRVTISSRRISVHILKEELQPVVLEISFVVQEKSKPFSISGYSGTKTFRLMDSIQRYYYSMTFNN